MAISVKQHKRLTYGAVLASLVIFLDFYDTGMLRAAGPPAPAAAQAAPAPVPELTEDQKARIAGYTSAVHDADLALAASSELVRAAKSQAAFLTGQGAFLPPNNTSLVNWKAASLTLERIVKSNNYSRLADKDTLVAAGTAIDQLTAPSADDPQAIKDEWKPVSTKKAKLDSAKTAQDDARTALRQSIKGTLDNAGLFWQALDGKLKALKDQSKDTAKDDIPKLPGFLADHLDALLTVRNLASSAEPLSTQIRGTANSLQDTDIKTSSDNVGTKADVVSKSLADVVAKLSPWFKSLDALNKDSKDSIDKEIPVFAADPEKEYPNSQKLSRDAGRQLDQLNLIRGEWLKIQVAFGTAEDTKEALTDAGEDAGTVYLSTLDLGLSKTALDGAIAGDAENDEIRTINLYYFTNVPRLLEILNPSAHSQGGDPAAQARADAARKALVEAEENVVSAAQAVSSAQPRIAALQDEKTAAESAVANQIKLLTKATRSREDVENNPKHKASDLLAAQRTEEDRQKELDSSQARLDQVNSEASTLTGLIDELKQAQDTLNRARTSARSAANDEIDAFVRARDNAPYIFAPAIVTSKDPVQRIRIFGFRDSNTLFLRGHKDEVEKAVDIIAQFDTPAPQARLTLWNLQLNGSGNKGGIREFNQSLAKMESVLATTRRQLTDSTALLRRCVNEEVNAEARGHFHSDDQGEIKEEEVEDARFLFYAPAVLRKMGGHTPVNGDHVSSPSAVLYDLLPDPTKTTTLGETLMVMCLAPKETQDKIWSKFEANYRQLPGSRGLPCFESLKYQLWAGELKEAPAKKIRVTSAQPTPTPAPTATSGTIQPQSLDLTPMQGEIVTALQNAALPQAKRKLRVLMGRILARSAKLVQDPDQPFLEAEQLEDIEAFVDLAHYFDSLHTPVNSETTLTLETVKTLVDIPAAAKSLLHFYYSMDKAAKADGTTHSTAFEILLGAAGSNAFIDRKSQNARVAAADEMLKRLLVAAEDDMDAQFVTPAVNHLRDELAGAKVNVGIVGRTSLLATNRSLARIDPKASAQLEIGEVEDARVAANQALQVVAASQSAGLLGGVGVLSGSKSASQPEIYGITSGSAFQVTPIFDPTGQALRFKFDYLQTTDVREPNGTVNPQLPRVDRQTLNTEVQLSNLEMREVSRFEANSKLGIPTLRTGGVPILKDLPVFRSLPLIGWFTRRRGSAGVIQENVIFAQTAIYPSMVDLVELLRIPANPEDEVNTNLNLDFVNKTLASKSVVETIAPEDNVGADGQ